MLWSVVRSEDRSRRVIFAESFWATVTEVAEELADPAEFRLAIVWEAFCNPAIASSPAGAQKQ